MAETNKNEQLANLVNGFSDNQANELAKILATALKLQETEREKILPKDEVRRKAAKIIDILPEKPHSLLLKAVRKGQETKLIKVDKKISNAETSIKNKKDKFNKNERKIKKLEKKQERLEKANKFLNGISGDSTLKDFMLSKNEKAQNRLDERIDKLRDNNSKITVAIGKEEDYIAEQTAKRESILGKINRIGVADELPFSAIMFFIAEKAGTIDQTLETPTSSENETADLYEILKELFDKDNNKNETANLDENIQEAVDKADEVLSQKRTEEIFEEQLSLRENFEDSENEEIETEIAETQQDEPQTKNQMNTNDNMEHSEFNEKSNDYFNRMEEQAPPLSQTDYVPPPNFDYEEQPVTATAYTEKQSAYTVQGGEKTEFQTEITPQKKETDELSQADVGVLNNPDIQAGEIKVKSQLTAITVTGEEFEKMKPHLTKLKEDNPNLDFGAKKLTNGDIKIAFNAKLSEKVENILKTSKSELSTETKEIKAKLTV